MCDCFWKKMCSYFLELCRLKKYFEVKPVWNKDVHVFLVELLWWKSCWKNPHCCEKYRSPFSYGHWNNWGWYTTSVFTFWQHSNWREWILRKPRNRYRINCLHRGTDPEIVDLFWIEKILKPQKHLLSIKHRLFSMTLACFLTLMNAYYAVSSKRF